MENNAATIKYTPWESLWGGENILLLLEREGKKEAEHKILCFLSHILVLNTTRKNVGWKFVNMFIFGWQITADLFLFFFKICDFSKFPNISVLNMCSFSNKKKNGDVIYNVGFLNQAFWGPFQAHQILFLLQWGVHT